MRQLQNIHVVRSFENPKISERSLQRSLMLFHLPSFAKAVSFDYFSGIHYKVAEDK